jgi:hypothetical protein
VRLLTTAPGVEATTTLTVAPRLGEAAVCKLAAIKDSVLLS